MCEWHVAAATVVRPLPARSGTKTGRLPGDRRSGLGRAVCRDAGGGAGAARNDRTARRPAAERGGDHLVETRVLPVAGGGFAGDPVVVQRRVDRLDGGLRGGCAVSA